MAVLGIPSVSLQKSQFSNRHGQEPHLCPSFPYDVLSLEMGTCAHPIMLHRAGPSTNIAQGTER